MPDVVAIEACRPEKNAAAETINNTKSSKPNMARPFAALSGVPLEYEENCFGDQDPAADLILGHAAGSGQGVTSFQLSERHPESS